MPWLDECSVQILEIIEKSTEMQWHLKFTEISLGYRIVLKKMNGMCWNRDALIDSTQRQKTGVKCKLKSILISVYDSKWLETGSTFFV